MVDYYEDELSKGGGGGGGKKQSSSVGFKNRFSNSNYTRSTGSKSPQAMMKISSHVRGHRVMNVLEYISRTDKENELELEDENGSLIRGKDQIKELHHEWAEDFERAKPNAKRLPRHASHIVLSAKAENTPENQDKVLEAARETCREMLGERGYRYVIGVHQDGSKPHVHVAVNSYNRDKSLGKLRLGKEEIFEFRARFAERLTELGLKHEATLRRDRPELAKAMREGKEPLKSDYSKPRHFFKTLGKHEQGEHLQGMERGACRFKEAVNKSDLAPKEKKYLKAKIREFEQGLLNKPDDLFKHRETLAKNCSRYIKQFPREFNETVNPSLMTEKKRDGKKLSNLLDKLTDRDIGKARVGVDKIKDPEQRKHAKDSLQEFMGKLTGKSKGELLLQDTKDTFKMVMDRINGIDKELKNNKLSVPERLHLRREKEKYSEGLEKFLDKRGNQLKPMFAMSKDMQKSIKMMQQMRAMQMQLSKVLGLGLGR